MCLAEGPVSIDNSMKAPGLGSRTDQVREQELEHRY